LRTGLEASDLPLVRQQLARALRIGHVERRLFVRADVQVVEPQFAVVHPREGVGEIRVARAERLHFRSDENEARFELF
jgi:hypothetical protein